MSSKESKEDGAGSEESPLRAAMEGRGKFAEANRGNASAQAGHGTPLSQAYPLRADPSLKLRVSGPPMIQPGGRRLAEPGATTADGDRAPVTPNGREENAEATSGANGESAPGSGEARS